MEMKGTCERSTGTIRERLARIGETELNAMRTIDEIILIVTGNQAPDFDNSEEKCMVDSIDLIAKRMEYLLEQITILRGIIA